MFQIFTLSLIFAIIFIKKFFHSTGNFTKKFSKFSDFKISNLEFLFALTKTCFGSELVNEASHKNSQAEREAKIFVAFFSFVVYFSINNSHSFII